MPNAKGSSGCPLRRAYDVAQVDPAVKWDRQSVIMTDHQQTRACRGRLPKQKIHERVLGVFVQGRGGFTRDNEERVCNESVRHRDALLDPDIVAAGSAQIGAAAKCYSAQRDRARG